MSKGITKYKVTVVKASNSAFPGSEVKTFEIVEKNDKVITEPYLKECAEKKGFRGWQVIAFIPVLIVNDDLEPNVEIE